VLVAVAAEQTFATVNGDVFISGLSFEDYMVGFNCDDVPAGAKLRFDGLTFTDCGLMGTAGGRVNHQAAIQCRDVDAAVIDSLFVTNCILEGGDFGICWRGGFDQATIAFNRFEGQTRMGVMLGDNTADQKTRKAAKVLYNRFKDIIGTSATENEIHAALVYAYDALVQGNSVDTVYDIHSATHDSEAIYLKAVFWRVLDNFVRNGGRGEGFIAIKGQVSTADPEGLSAGTAYSLYGLAQGNVVYATPAFVTSYGKHNGILTADGSRNLVRGNVLLGDFDRALNVNAGSIEGNLIYGDSTYGIRVDADADTDELSRVSGNKLKGSFISAAIEARNSQTTATAWAGVQINDNAIECPATTPAAVSIRPDRVASGNNSIELVQVNGLAVKGHSELAAVRFSLASGTGNNGKVTSALISDLSIDTAASAIRVDGGTDDIATLTLGAHEYVDVVAPVVGLANITTPRRVVYETMT
jgi:hypothetical protein